MTAIGKADLQFSSLHGCFVPFADSRNILVSVDLRPRAVIKAGKELTCLVARIRLEWPSGFSQISMVPRPDGVARSGSFFGGMVKIGCLYFLNSHSDL